MNEKYCVQNYIPEMDIKIHVVAGSNFWDGDKLLMSVFHIFEHRQAAKRERLRLDPQESIYHSQHLRWFM